MKKLNFSFIMVGLVFLISISVLSCQANDADDYSQQAEDVTAADLFIASEAYHNLEKEIGKEMRRERNAIAKLSKEELEQYQLLKKEMLDIETCTEAIAQLKVLVGYDYQANRDRISSLVRDVFKDVNFTKLELMRARQKSQMYKVVITRADTNAELREKCKKDCDETTKEDIIECHNHFNEDIKDLPASEFPDGENYKFWVKVRDACISAAQREEEDCKKSCDKSYPDEE